MKWALGILAVVITLALMLMFRSGTDVVVATAVAPEAVAAGHTAPLTAAAAPQADVITAEPPAALPELSDDEMDAWLPRLNNDAIASMAQARTQGDSRTPPIVRAAPRQMPTAAELADEELYQKYEQRQEKRLFRAYVEASTAKIAVIESFIDQAEAGGISEEEIAFAKKKIEGIRAQSEQLLRDHPDLMADDDQSPDNWLPATDGR